MAVKDFILVKRICINNKYIGGDSLAPKIGVLLGGRSSEREVSLRTGAAIYNALLEKGYNAVKIDVADDIVHKLQEHRIDLAFIALHGKYGEDGTIQGLLEMYGIPYTGPGVLASAIAINKIMTKKLLLYEGIPTPDFTIVTASQYKKLPFASILGKITTLGLPLVVKPATQGSSIGISFVHHIDEIQPALEEGLKYDSSLLVEKKLQGMELTAAVLGNDEPEVLPLIEIVTTTGVYDYTTKYTAGLSDHIIPPRLGDDVQEQVKDLAKRVYLALGCQGLSRIDFILAESCHPFVLEVNTMPGMTETSLFPDAARAVNMSFADLTIKIVELAMQKT